MGPSTTPVIYLYLFSTNFTNEREKRDGRGEGGGGEKIISFVRILQ